MFDLVQKHKRVAQVILFLLMVPFAFFGVDYYFRGGASEAAVATVAALAPNVPVFDRPTEYMALSNDKDYGLYDGDIQTVTAGIGSSPVGGPFPIENVPGGLDWEMWLGQAPKVDYREKRCHYEFRWWYEYSGGKFTDWGAHHVDIAQWALKEDAKGKGPTKINGTEATMLSTSGRRARAHSLISPLEASALPMLSGSPNAPRKRAL
jgi:hypothetical protein